MYILDSEITLNWELKNISAPVLISDFDVVVKRPDGTHVNHYGSLYLDTAEAVTEATESRLSYTFTPDIEGVWEVSLTSGASAAYDIKNTYSLTVHSPDISVYQQVRIRSLDSAIATLLSGTSIEDGV